MYAIEFDLEMNKIVEEYNGLYRRYSDDFIIVLPKKISYDKFNKITQQIFDFAEKNKIVIQDEKTNSYEYFSETIINLISGKNSHLDYLGFLFDGNTVKIRGKSPYKFYRNASIIINRARRIQYKKRIKKKYLIEKGFISCTQTWGLNVSLMGISYHMQRMHKESLMMFRLKRIIKC
ncbi:hypothetical protein RWE15_11475 [Virgibacillus halophilus]|uniref:Reverse transcriptase domain-containing protein n=1 Tax=Tigheibacillus halophilus TaxID=361280 RepID=A0ABU5C6I3_9BACI|nr:hypothetical protein [Virgibacillus halophilus]